jgi:biotin carboxyl carrier protein
MKTICFVPLVFFLVLNLFPNLYGVSIPNQSSPDENQNQEAVPKKSFSFEKKVVCMNALEIRALVSGTVSRNLVAKGDRVLTGQLLLGFDVSKLEEEIREAEEKLEVWKKTLFNREHWKVRSQPAENQAKRKISEFQSVISEKKQQKSRQQIHSLIDGRVLDIVEEKIQVEVDQVVARIGDDSMLKIGLTRDEINRDVLDKIRDGDKIFLTFVDVNQGCSGEIKKVTDGLIILIPNEKYALNPGMVAGFELSYQLKPESSLKEEKPKPQTQESKPIIGKKIGFEISAGMSFSDPGDHYNRAVGIDSLMEQYIQNYGLDYTVSGSFGKNIFFYPINALVNYRVSEKWYLKGGLEFAYGNQSSQKTYRLDWTGTTENHRYDLSSKLTYIMPFVGAETRFGKFGIYANVGLNFLSFSHQKNLEVSETTYWHNQDEEISASGSGIGIMLGGKYTFLIGNKTKLLLKLEFCYMKVSTLTGNRDTSLTNSFGESFSESIQGTIYSFEINPYDLGWFSTWEMLGAVPGESWIRNVTEMAFNMSSIRLMLGITF